MTRWTTDATCETGGFYIYLRDLDDNFVWSAGFQPTRATASQYEFRCERGVAEILRVDCDIECRFTVCVSTQHDFEIRRCQLTNLGQLRRTLEITSYLEWVLGCRDADAAHPAFSKLFVETQYCAERRAILARRRPRHNDDAEFWGFHAAICDPDSDQLGKIEFETNRVRFIGRGRTLERPRALDPGRVLSGDFGSVLDPIASLRIPIALEPNEAQEVAFVLGAAQNRADIDRSLEAIRDLAQVHRAFDEAQAADSVDGSPRDSARLWSETAHGERIIVHPPHRPSPPAGDANGAPIFPPATFEVTAGSRRPADAGEPLQFDNGLGGFSADGREYVMRIEPDGQGGHRRPPVPWVNVIANEQLGFIVSESGAGYTWCGNSRLNRLTAWHNDPVTDPHSEAFWIRDEDAGVFWSPMPGPTPAASNYIVRHGFGYTRFEHESHGLWQEATMFVAREDPVKITRLRLVNRSGRTRRLSLFSYLHWALGGLANETLGQVATDCDADQRVIWATNPHREHYDGCVAFSALRCDSSPTGDGLVASAASCTCDRSSFLGPHANLQAPAAIVSGGELDRRSGNWLDPCAAWQVAIELPPDAVFECTYLLGEAADRETAGKVIDRYANNQQVQHALERATAFWRDLLSAITIETPDRELDLMVNGWLVYQNVCCRMWARSAYYQPGGAYGFRDQLQDSAALVYHWPEIVRTQILRHATQQFVEGDVLHWWHPDTGYGLRTRFSDDLLWLPYVAAEYVQKTGDAAILDESLPFIEGTLLADGQQEQYLLPGPSGVEATLYEHCCRALDRGLTSGPHGLPLIGCGDWNDGFSRVGRQGRGESVWLGFFIDHILERILPICARRADDERVAQYTAYRERLREALNSAGWDGAWYRRAYYDNGEPIGSSSSDECQVDAIAQAWCVLSGVAPPERARMAMDEVEKRLIDSEAGMIRLLTPPFDKTPNDPGYIKGYVPGIRENGGQYTHGVLWVVRAMAEMGRGTRAVELLKMLTPVWHTRSSDDVGVYQTEPYVVAADVYGEPPHVGRGGWTWYTGSAGWMLRVAVESILGLTIEGGRTLVINPSISSAWPQCRLIYRLPDGQTTYDITIENPSGNERGVKLATLDSMPAVVENGVARIPLARDGKAHRVSVRL